MANQYLSDRAAYDAKAKEWTERYANPEGGDAARIAKFVDMGFPKDKVLEALQQSDDDNVVISFLLS